MSNLKFSFISVLAIIIPCKGLILIAGIGDIYHLSVILTIPVGLFVISICKDKPFPSKLSLVMRILIALIFINLLFPFLSNLMLNYAFFLHHYFYLKLSMIQAISMFCMIPLSCDGSLLYNEDLNNLKLESLESGVKCTLALRRFNLENDKAIKLLKLKDLMRVTRDRWVTVKAIDKLADTDCASKSFLEQPHTTLVVSYCRKLAEIRKNK